MNHICIFEDDKFELLYPLVYSRPVFELRCGMLSLVDRIKRYYRGCEIEVFCREYLAEVYREWKPFRVNELDKSAESCLFINGRLLMQEAIPLDGPEEVGIKDDTIVYMRLNRSNYNALNTRSFLSGDFKDILKQQINVVECDALFINYFWDLLKENSEQIKKDFKKQVKNGSILGDLYDGVYFVNREDVFVDKGAKIKPGCVLDAENGPIYISKNAIISSNSTIEGPVFIGEESKINAHSRILGGSNIGDLCKMGGEVVNSIVHDFSNKPHDGFLGHACLGSWVNLGADTVNSNLKNTYENVSIKFNKKIICSDQMFLGIAVGDHTKSAINTTFMTGSVVGFGSNVVSSKFPPRFIPSFCWSIDVGIAPQSFENVMQTAEIVMQRRGKNLSDAEKRMYKKVYDITAIERSK